MNPTRMPIEELTFMIRSFFDEYTIAAILESIHDFCYEKECDDTELSEFIKFRRKIL